MYNSELWLFGIAGRNQYIDVLMVRVSYRLFISFHLCDLLCSNYYINLIFFAEMELGTKCVVDMDDKQTVLYNPGLILKDG